MAFLIKWEFDLYPLSGKFLRYVANLRQFHSCTTSGGQLCVRRVAERMNLRLTLLVATATLLIGCSGGADRSSVPAPVSNNTSDSTAQIPGDNTAPVAVNDFKSTTDSALNIAVLENDSDPDGDALSVLFVGRPANGLAEISDNGTPSFSGDDQIVYTARAGFVGTDIFSYTVSDDRDGRANAYVTVNVGAAGAVNPAAKNQAPVANSDRAVTQAPAAVTIDVLANDIDGDNELLSLLSVSAAENGSVRIDTNGTDDTSDDRLVYSPNPGFSGEDTLTYAVSDGIDVTIGSVRVSVSAVSETPQPLAPEGNVCGIVTLGPVNDALVSVFALSPEGLALGGVLAAARTNPQGRWCAELPEDRGDLLVVARGGIFPDPSDSRYESGAARLIPMNTLFALESVLPADSDFSAVTVFSNAALTKSRVETEGDNFAAVFERNRQQSQAAFGFDVFTTDVADPVLPDVLADNISRQYAMAVGAAATSLNQIAVDLGVSAPNYILVDALIRDLSECRLDGADANGPIRVRIGSEERQISASLDLNLQIIRFRNNLTRVYADVPLLQVDQPVCEQVVVAADTTPPEFVSLPETLVVSVGTGTSVAISSDAIARFLDSAIATDDRDGNVATVARQIDGSAIPNELSPGVYTVVFSATDSAGNTADSQPRVIDVGSAAPPLAFADQFELTEDTPVTLAVLDNDVGQASPIDPASVVVELNPGAGQVTVDAATGLLFYVPEADYSGVDLLRYSVADQSGTRSTSAEVRLQIAPVNDVPQSRADSQTTFESTTVEVNVLANDSDAENQLDIGSVDLVLLPDNGEATTDFVSGNIVYSPTPGFTGTDQFSYTVADTEGARSGEAVVTVRVVASGTPLDQPPVAIGDFVRVDEDASVQIRVSANDIDDNNLLVPASVVVITAPAYGTLTAPDAEGVLTYTPGADYFGIDQFTYQIADAAGQRSAVASVFVTIDAVNDAPVAIADSVQGLEDSELIVALLENDLDRDGLAGSSVELLTLPQFGTAVWDANASRLIYTPVAGFDGTDSLAYRVVDTDGAASEAATVTLSLIGENDAPMAQADAFTVQSNTTTVLNVLVNDVDVDSVLSASDIRIDATPQFGSVIYSPMLDGLVYTANTAYVGVDEFSYTVFDPEGASSESVTVALQVELAGVAPVAVPDAATAQEQVPLVIDVAANDRDDDNDLDITSVQLVALPVFGTATVTPSGQISYVSVDNYAGSDQFSYSIADSEGNRSTPAEVIVAVLNVSEPPVAANDASATSEESAIAIAVVANDSDPDGDLDVTSVLVVNSPGSGSASVNAATGVVTYVPDANFSGVDVFTYSVADVTGLRSPEARVDVTVTAVNDAPTALEDAVTTDEDTSVEVQLLVNDSDVDSALDPSSVTFSQLPLNGVVTLNAATGVVIYTPNPDFFGSDEFFYIVADAEGLTSEPARVAVTVTAINDRPVAQADTGTTDEDMSVTLALLDNDSDPDGTLDDTSVVVTQLPANGTVNVVGGQVTYTPAADFSGTDQFAYRVSDNEGGVSDDALVSLTILALNDAPVAVNDATTTDENVAVTVDVGANDSDPDGAADITGVQISSAPSLGTVAPGPGVTEFIYTPDPDANGLDQFSYQAFDAAGLLSAPATVSVTIAPLPSVPVTVDRAVSVANNVTIDIRVLTGATDPENNIDPSSVELVADVTSGSTQVLPDGQVRYTPELTFSGIQLFTYRVSDTSGLVSNTSTVTIDVTDPETGPLALDLQAPLVFRGDRPVIDLTLAVSDADGTVDFSTLTVSNASVGTPAVIGTTGTVDYELPAEFVGVATFNYSVKDNDGLDSNTAEVSMVVWPSEDRDLDGVGESIELDVGTDPAAADSVYVFIDANTPAVSPDGSSWELAYASLGDASADGKLVSAAGNTVYVLIADNSDATIIAREWQLTLTANCDNMVFVGSLDPFVALPAQTDLLGPSTRFESVEAGQRPVTIDGCADVHFYGVSLSGGNGVDEGGGLWIGSADVSLDGVLVSDNQAHLAGGGVYVDGSGAAPSTLAIANSTLRDNVLTPPDGQDSSGGGLHSVNGGSLSITDSIIRNNEANATGSVSQSVTRGGGGVYIVDTPAYLSGTVMSGNRAEQCGGGLHVSGNDSIRVEHNILSGNEVNGLGGGVCIRDTNANLTFHNNLIVSNYAEEGGGMYLLNMDKSRVTNNTAVLNLAKASGGGVQVDPGADPVLSYNVAQFNQSEGSANDVGGAFSQLTGLDASYNFITSFFANFVGTGNSSQFIEFDRGYYQLPSSPGIDYGAINADDPLFALNLRYTDRTGTTTDLGVLDVGYHYLEPETGSPNQLQVSAPQTLTSGLSNQVLRLAPLVNGERLGPGHRLYIESSDPSVATHLYTYTDLVLDPLGTGGSTQLTDLGDGFYEVLLDIPDNTNSFSLQIFIDSISTSTFSLQIQ